jgi:hypothetical protein
MEPLTRRRTWKPLSTHDEAIERLHLRDLFARDPGRGERMAAEGAGLFLGYSKNGITDQTIELPIELAEESGLRSRIEAMCRGDKLNLTENRRSPSVSKDLQTVGRRRIEQVLRETDGNKSRAASRLGLSRTQL